MYPTLPVVEELFRRGHRVSYPVTDRRAAVVAATGARTLPYESVRPSDTDRGFVLPPAGDYLGEVMRGFLREAATTLPQLEPQLADDPPDLVVFDRMSFAGRTYA